MSVRHEVAARIGVCRHPAIDDQKRSCSNGLHMRQGKQALDVGGGV